SVVDEFRCDERVQQSLDRWIRRHRVEEVGALNAYHVLVGKSGPRAQFLEGIETNCRQASRLNRGHVPTAAFHAQNFDLIAEEVARPRLHRSVPTAMKH